MKKIPPKLKKPVSIRKLMEKVMTIGMVVFLIYVFFINDNHGPENTENSVDALRFLRSTDNISARLSGGMPTLDQLDDLSFTTPTLPTAVSEKWVFQRQFDAVTAISTNGLMWCRLAIKGSVNDGEIDYDATIENSVERGMRRILGWLFKIDDISIQRISDSADRRLYMVRTVSLWRGRLLYEYSYHAFASLGDSDLYHFCASAHNGQAMGNDMLEILREIEVAP